MNEVDAAAKILWDYNLAHQEPSPSDAILALGSKDIRVAERAAELWHEGFAPLIVASGGFGRLTGTDKEPEADTFERVLLSRGVPPRAILVERTSTNTESNLRLSMEMLEQATNKPRKVIIVTMPNAEKRTFATIKKVFPEVTSLHTSPTVSYEKYPNEEITKDFLLQLIVGDTKRIEVYPDRGFTVRLPIPEAVKAAMEYLISQGYDKQLPK